MTAMNVVHVHNHDYGQVIAGFASIGVTVFSEASDGSSPSLAIEVGSGTGAVFYTGSVNRAQLTDTLLGFDVYGTMGQCYRLYQAAFNRVPDEAGLSNNVSIMDGGVTLVGMADAFLGGAEGIADYGSLTDTQFIQALYTNVLKRTGSTAEVNAWLALMATGYTRSNVLIGFSESTENHGNVDGAISSGVKMIQSYFPGF